MLWSQQHLRRQEGWWTEKEGVSGPDGSEGGKCGEVVRTQMRKPRIIRKGAKSKKCRKEERSERGKTECGKPKKTGGRQSRRGEGNRKESEINGEGCAEGAREPGRHQSSVKMLPVSRGSGVPGLVLSRYRDPAGPVPQVGHVNQQVDSCQDGHRQSLVPDAHIVGKSVLTAHIPGPLGLPAKLFVKLVKRPEDQSTDVEKDGEQAQHQMERGGNGQPVLIVSQVQQDGHDPQEETDGVHGHTRHQQWVVHVQVRIADEG